jgi:hypothetical protein
MDVLSVIGLITVLLACLVASIILAVRPWDSNSQRYSSYLSINRQICALCRFCYACTAITAE